MYGTSRLSPRTREFLVIQSGHIGVARTARENGTTARTVYRWRRRTTFVDRSSRPHHSPRRTPDDVEATIVGLRLELRWGPDLLGPYLALHPSTVHRVLRRHNAHRLSHLFPKPRRSFGQFPDLAPGELIAIDTKALGSIERGGGRRHHGEGPRGPNVGWRHLHVAIDLASRLVFAQLRATASNHDTIAFLRDASAFFDARGIRVRRVLTDNGTAYKRSFDEAAASLGIRHTRTKPYHPWTNGRVERFMKTISEECLYTRPLHSDQERALVIALYVAYYNAERPHTRLGGLSPLEWLARR